LTVSAVRSPSLSEEIGIVSSAAAQGYYPRNKLRGLERDRARLEAKVAVLRLKSPGFTETIAELRQQILQAAQKPREEAGKDLADVRGKIAGLNEQIEVARDALTRVEVRAPHAGIILGVKVKNAGAVVQPGATLAEVVPMSTLVALAAHVSPLMWHSVAVGQQAQIRFPAFAAHHVAALCGHVETVSADAVQDDTTKKPISRAGYHRHRQPAAELAKKIVPGMPADVLSSPANTRCWTISLVRSGTG